MTKVSKLSGPMPVPENMPLVNYLTTTEGEFSLQLMRQRLGLFHHIFPQKKKIWAQGARMIDNVLYNSKKEGVHGATAYLGSVPPELYFVAQKIKAAQAAFAPAGEAYLGRKDKRLGLSPDAYNFGINGPITAFPDVLKELQKLHPRCEVVFDTYEDSYGNVHEREYFKDPSCVPIMSMMLRLNELLPKNSHNGLYAFMPIADANNPRLTSQLTASKVNDHIKYFNAFASTTKISNNNVKEWLRNCVMHKNAYNNIPSLTPEDNINQLRLNPSWSTVDNWDNSEQDRIGLPIFAIILIIIVSAKALGGLIQILKDKEPTAFQGLDDIALRAMDFAGSGTDFQGSGGGATVTEAQCKAMTGYKWNSVLKTCDKIDTGGGNDGGGNDGGGNNNNNTSNQWIDGVPNVVVGGAAALLAGAVLLK